jgi:ABC-type branched-subunit amino acid transport system permease subunit
MLIALAAVTFIIPFCNLAFPADSPLHFSAYTVSVPGKYLTFALLGLSLDLVWGYCGFWPWDTAAGQGQSQSAGRTGGTGAGRGDGADGA